MAHWMTACVYWGPTPVEDGIRRIELIIQENAGRRSVEAGAMRCLGGLKAMRGEFDGARADIAQANRLAAEIGHQQIIVSSGAHFSAGVELLAGDPQRALEEALPSYEAMAATGDLSFSSTAAGRVAWALLELGRLDDAEHYARITLDTAAESDGESQALGRQVQAQVLAHRGDFEEADRTSSEAVAIREGGEYLNGHAEVLLARGEVLRLAGRPAEAAAAFSEAAELFDRKGNVVMVGRTRRKIAELG